MSEEEEARPLKGLSVPDDIKDRIKRGREDMRKDAPLRRVCMKFWQGEQYWYVKQRGGLGVLSTALDAVDKQQFRIRNTYNFIHSVVEGKVSAATQRIPGYEIDPSSTDPEDIAGARIAQQVAFYGYDKWRMRRHRTKLVTNALVQREGFIYPYFDPNVGAYEEVPKLAEDGLPVVGEDGELEMEWRAPGDIRFLNLCRSEVGWEPGVDFDDSPWHIVVRAMLKEQVERIPGFFGGTLTTDARTSDLPTEKQSDEMVVLTEYLERPCPDYPQGRRLFIANDRVIAPKEDYPSADADGNVTDDLVIHRLSYTVDPHGDDRGLVEHLIDLQRTILDCWNKLLEYKNRALNLQMTQPNGANMARRDDTPGATWTYNVIAGMKPEWERLPEPGYVDQLIRLLELAVTHMRLLAADYDVPEDLQRVAARSLQAGIEQAQARWQGFLADFAECDSRLMRHCLTLVAQNYEQERIIQIRGEHGWEPPLSFTGQDMRSQMNVRVLPGSIESRSRSTVMEELRFIVETWGPDAVRPEIAMSAFHGGNVETLFKSYDLHKARAWALVQKVRQNYQQVLEMPMRLDPELGDPQMGFMVPGWMPRKQDNVAIWKQVIADYMISPDFDEQPVEVQHMFDLIWNGIEALERRRMMMLQAQMQDAAAEQGQANAARPQGDIPMPQRNGGLSREQAEPAAGAPS